MALSGTLPPDQGLVERPVGGRLARILRTGCLRTLALPTDCPSCGGAGIADVTSDHATMCTCDVVPPGSRGVNLPGKTTHAQALLRGSHRVAWVDRAIAPMIEVLWAGGVDTWCSCQGGGRVTPDSMGYVQAELSVRDRAVEIVTDFSPVTDVIVRRWTRTCIVAFAAIGGDR